VGLLTLLTQPVVVEQWADTGEKDGYGNPIRAKTGEVEELGYLERADSRGQSTEVQLDRDTFVSDWTLVLRAGVIVAGGDRIRYAGDAFEVIGEPARPWNPRTRREHHLELRLRHVSG
jgi:hypothetical protein